MKTVVIDPVTRIEGHLRIELEIDGEVIVRARSSGTSFRGFENVLRGRNPGDAVHISQRVCGICPIPHGRAACEALEQAAGVAITEQARLLRNIVQAVNFIDSHLLHFYTLALPDYVAGLAVARAGSQRAHPRAWRGGEALDVGRLMNNLASSLRQRRACHEIIVALAGKMPHAAGIVPGGATVIPSVAMIDDLKSLARGLRTFVDDSYAGDVTAVASAFAAYEKVGVSSCALLAYGAFPGSDGQALLPGGFVLPDGTAGTVAAAAITESTATARYSAGAPAHPSEGATSPALDRTDAYSWIKAPRHAGHACEVGPLARAVLSGRDPGGRGVMARHRARQGEASLLASLVESWLAQLTAGAPALTTFPAASATGTGAGLTEAPRGALGHWVAIEGSLVSHYGIVSPTTWNASPRDENGAAGPLERALESLVLADPADPIEAVRVVHSFDPCLQCAVH